MIKLYIQEQEHPWISWDKTFYKVISKSPIFQSKIELVNSKKNANLVIANIKALPTPKDITTQTMLYVPEYSNNYASYLAKIESTNGCILVDNVVTYAKYADESIPVYLWRKPTRVSIDDMREDKNVTREGFMTVLDVAHVKSNVRDLSMAMMSKHETISDDMKIFSASELPFEPFNNIRYEGLQTNKTLLNTMKSSKAFVYPAEIEGFPTGLVEAALLGTPIIAKKTGITVEMFGNNSDFLYETQDELEELLEKRNNMDSYDYAQLRMTTRHLAMGDSSHISESTNLLNIIFNFIEDYNG